ncbi:MAG: alpha-E domain-containing protein [Gammaproteobacteria bacterium]
MLSRSADRIYWLARYLERTENIARLVAVYMNLLYDLPKSVEMSWRTLIGITGDENLFRELYKSASERNVIRYLISDLSNPGSLYSSLCMARENIRTTRELMPDETWEQINEMYLLAKSSQDVCYSRRGRALFLGEISEGCQRFAGLLSGGMSHNDAYRFLRIGRNIERADMTTRILDAGTLLMAQERSTEIQQYENMLWINVLKSLSALLMYRKQVRTRIKGSDVLDFLIKDGDFPRSVAHCIDEIGRCVVKLPRYGAMIDLINELSNYLEYIDIKAADHDTMHRSLDDIQIKLGLLHRDITHTWFIQHHSE